MGMDTLDQLAARQYGHLSHAQLRAVLTDHTIRRRRSRGLYLPVHRGVIRVASHPESEFGRYAAALLAVGAPAALDGRVALRAHGLTAIRPVTPVDVVVPYQRVPRPLPGVCIHRTRRWNRLAVTTINNLAVPSLTATAARLAPHVSNKVLVDVLQDMVRLGVDTDALYALATARLAGSPALRRAIGALSISAKSALERIVVPALEAAGLAGFARNVTIQGERGDVIEEVDVLFDDSAVAVQLDGWAFHHDRRRFQRDRASQNRLALEHGLLVLRFTHADVTRRLPTVIEQIRAAVDARRPMKRGA